MSVSIIRWALAASLFVVFVSAQVQPNITFEINHEEAPLAPKKPLKTENVKATCSKKKGIEIKVDFGEQVKGVLVYSDKCLTEAEKEKEASITLIINDDKTKKPEDVNEECVIPSNPQGLYSRYVVVQSNGVPTAGAISSLDSIFLVSCNFEKNDEAKPQIEKAYPESAGSLVSQAIHDLIRFKFQKGVIHADKVIDIKIKVDNATGKGFTVKSCTGGMKNKDGNSTFVNYVKNSCPASNLTHFFNQTSNHEYIGRIQPFFSRFDRDEMPEFVFECIYNLNDDSIQVCDESEDGIQLDANSEELRMFKSFLNFRDFVLYKDSVEKAEHQRATTPSG